MSGLRVGILGGSFDPFHIGHERLMLSALRSGKIDRLILLPTGLPPHKKRRLSFASYRLHMCELAAAGLGRVQVSSYEISRPGRFSYTADTLAVIGKEVQAERPGKVKLRLIYGSDAIDTFPDWHEPERIMAQARLLIALRGDDAEMEQDYRGRADLLEKRYGGKIRFFFMEPIEISSTELREELAGGSVRAGAYPAAVETFLKQNQAYVYAEELASLDDEEAIRLALYEEKLSRLLRRERMLHSCNVSRYASHLARRHGLSPFSAAVAGLLHDACKEMPIREQYGWAEQSAAIMELNHAIAHGPAAAACLPSFFGIGQQEILTAIAYHTTGCPGLSPLGKILFLADKIEFGRSFAGLQPIREAAEHDLDEACRLCLSEVILALKRRGRGLHPLSRAWAEELELDTSHV